MSNFLEMIVLFMLIKMVSCLFSCQFAMGLITLLGLSLFYIYRQKIHFSGLTVRVSYSLNLHLNNMDALYCYFHIFTRFDYEYRTERILYVVEDASFFGNSISILAIKCENAVECMQWG